ncbi:ankyrin repeat-containing domain protein [Flagelloscypha sp. PMI_526]|nr:ankyrin repeat-containing domain protein [Flagelloscypha sp. PMI_526]
MQMVVEKRHVLTVDGEARIILVPWVDGYRKTVMSSFVVETLRARDDVYVAFYYFEFTNPSTLSEEALLRSLVLQLACVSPAVMRAFHQKHSNGSLQPQLANLQNTLNELIAASKKPVFIVIDALDELPVTQRKYLLQSLVTFSGPNSASRAHIMVTSREEVDIRRMFKDNVDFELAVQGDLVRQDIAAFVDRELEAKRWTNWPRDAIELARRLLNERADGQRLFRMVACQVDILQQVRTYEQLQQSLHSLPKTLSETYDYILEKIPEHLRHQAHRLFTILSFAYHSVWIDELSALLAVEFGDEEDPTQLPTFREKNQFVDPLDIVDLGASLVSRDDDEGEVSLAHASVKEHFLAPTEVWFSLDEDFAHSVIARSCIALLVHYHSLQQGDLYDCPFSYSKYNWSDHIFPNGPPQLLRQQEHLYTSFPWPFILYEVNDYDILEGKSVETSSSLASAAFFGLEDLVRTLLNGRVWGEGGMADALMATMKSRRAKPIRMQCFQTLLAFGANVNTLTTTGTPIYYAAETGDLEFVQALVGMKANLNASGGLYGSAFQAGVLSGKLDVVRFLVENGADVNARGGLYKSALEAGASRGSLEIVHFLIENGAYASAGSGLYDLALLAGAGHGNLAVVQFLVEMGADVNARSEQDGTVLQAACNALYTASVETVRFLVEMGADVNASSGGFHGSALQVASGSYRASLDIVRFLVEQGANVNQSGGKGGSPLYAGASHGRLDIVRFLVENGADIYARGGIHGSALQAASCAYPGGSLDVVYFLVGKGADVNIGGGRYGSALQAGASQGNLEIVRFLVEHGADVNAGGGYHGSALQAASSAYRGNLGVVQFLVGKGAHVNAGGGHYGSALQAAASRGKLEIVHFLADNGADVHARGGKYGSVLQAASRARDGSLDLVHFLVRKGVDVNASGGKYGSALQAAASRGKIEIVRFLVENGADVDARGGKFGCALQAACCVYRAGLDTVHFLVDHGADVPARRVMYGSAFQEHSSAYHESLETVHFLAREGADVNACGGRYGSALQAGAFSGNLAIVRFLVEMGAIVNMSGGKYGSAIQAGAYRGKLAVVRFLVDNGAFVNAMGGEHKTPLDAAQTPYYGTMSTEKYDIVRFLKSCGSKTWEEMTDLSNDMWSDMEA